MLRPGHRRLIEKIVVFALIPLFLLSWIFQLQALPLKRCCSGRDPLQRLVNFFGLSAGFAVFSPQLPRANERLRALVSFEDGTMMLWQPWYRQRSDMLEGWSVDGFRQWSVDGLMYQSSAALLYPDACRYVASRCAAPGARPYSVQLIRYSTPIVPPGEHSAVGTVATPLYYYVVGGSDSL